MKKKIIALTMSGAMAATMMTIGSTSAWAEPIAVKDSPSQFGAQQSAHTDPKFLGAVFDAVKDVAGAVGRAGEAVKNGVVGTVEAALQGPGVEDLKGIAVKQAVDSAAMGYAAANAAAGVVPVGGITDAVGVVTKANSGGN